MNIDLRLPIGIIFSLFGLILVVYSQFSGDAVYAKHSLGININLEWGLVLLGFGILMLALSRWGKRKS
jgi:hypothetical protein